MQIGWSPGIGDPTWIGWLITASYFVAAWLCFICYRRSSNNSAMPVWLVLTVLMLLLGFNKQLDLQTLLTAIGRRVAYTQGWYEERREVQASFVAVMLVVFGALAIWIFFVARRHRREVRLSLIGTILLFVFVVERAATFEHLGTFHGRTFFGARKNAILELGGIGCVALGAWLTRRRVSSQ